MNPDQTEAEFFKADWRRRMANPEFRRIYEEEAAKKDLWIAISDARQAAGLTQADVALRLGVTKAHVSRIERRGYELCSLETLRRYVHALGEGFEVDVKIRYPAAIQRAHA